MQIDTKQRYTQKNMSTINIHAIDHSVHAFPEHAME